MESDSLVYLGSTCRLSVVAIVMALYIESCQLCGLRWFRDLYKVKNSCPVMILRDNARPDPDWQEIVSWMLAFVGVSVRGEGRLRRSKRGDRASAGSFGRWWWMENTGGPNVRKIETLLTAECQAVSLELQMFNWVSPEVTHMLW